MKKRMLSILLCLCMVLVLCPATAFAETSPEKYSLIIKFDHGTYHGCTGSYNLGDDYKAGDKYDITKCFNEIVDFAPYVFVATKNVTGTFTDSDMVAEFIFAMPEYSIDIEVSGYAVGNTPADCKIDAITSTIPDVSFDPEDKNDVLDIVWIDVDAGKTMSDTDVFQAEGTYEIDVTLARKGIPILPLATVDGKLCRHCRQWDDGDRTFLVACYMDKPAITLTVPFTTTVKQGGSTAPGKTTFELAVIGDSAPDLDKSDVTITGAVTTNGKGSYNGTLTFTGPERTLWAMLSEGAFVQQVNDGEAGWTVDDTVWGLVLDENPIALLSLDDEPEKYILYIYPTVCEEDDDGVYYSIEQNADPVERMTFTNTYTKSTYKPSENGTNTVTVTSPKTGDNSNLAVWFALLAVSAAGVMGAGVYSKRRRSSR